MPVLYWGVMAGLAALGIGAGAGAYEAGKGTREAAEEAGFAIREVLPLVVAVGLVAVLMKGRK